MMKLCLLESERIVIFLGDDSGRKSDSDAIVEQLRCVSKSRIGERTGCLSDEEMGKIENGVKLMLGIK